MSWHRIYAEETSFSLSEPPFDCDSLGYTRHYPPAFLKDIIKVSGDFFGSINGAMQSIGQIAILLFIGMIGVLSDKTGRKALAIVGFGVLAVFFILFLYSNSIASLLHIPIGFSATIHPEEV